MVLGTTRNGFGISVSELMRGCRGVEMRGQTELTPTPIAGFRNPNNWGQFRLSPHFSAFLPAILVRGLQLGKPFHQKGQCENSRILNEASDVIKRDWPSFFVKRKQDRQ